MTNTCPCGSKKAFELCCGSIINKKRIATTAEELMRSRYVAFTLGNINYLMLSHHSKTRPLKDKNKIERWAKSVKWMGLVILSTHEGLENDERGYVEFRALYLENGSMQQIHEKSIFEREGKSWVYVSGTHF